MAECISCEEGAPIGSLCFASENYFFAGKNLHTLCFICDECKEKFDGDEISEFAIDAITLEGM